MPVSTFMALCLSHPAYGYYMTRDPLGAAGDFTTAPEISGMFGEMLGGLIVHAWEQAGSPDRFTLLECGPGRGTLMTDLLRLAKRRPGFIEAMELVLLETSPVLRESQATLLSHVPHRHIGSLADLPDNGPLFVVANEFFDALPVSQYVRHKGKWFERVVGLENDALTFGLIPTEPRYEPRDFVETSELTQQIWGGLCAELERRGGMAVVVDYGYSHPGKGGDTLQAVQNHASVDPLESPGEADLTAHVDFFQLAQDAGQLGLTVSKIIPQGVFLKTLGIDERCAQMIGAYPANTSKYKSELVRLTAPDQMGELFKVLVVTSMLDLDLPGI